MVSPYLPPLVALANAARSRSRSLSLPLSAVNLRLVRFLEREGLVVGHLRLPRRSLRLHLSPHLPPLSLLPRGNRPLSALSLQRAFRAGHFPFGAFSTAGGLRTATEAALVGEGGLCLFVLPL